MRNRSRLVLGALTATLLFGIAVSASATRLAQNSETFRTTWNPMIFDASGFARVSCPVTLEGTFHSRTISKVQGSLIGYVTSALVAEPSQCRNGEATIFKETLPWHIRYLGFEGTLPNITAIRQWIVGARFRVHNNTFGTCTTTTSATEPGIGTNRREAGGAITETIAGGTIRTSGCFATSGTQSGTGTTTTQTGGRIIVTLVA